jgi:hypothetical protein
MPRLRQNQKQADQGQPAAMQLVPANPSAERRKGIRAASGSRQSGQHERVRGTTGEAQAMSQPINLRIVDIGDFRDGTLVVNQERRRYANAAVIEFASPRDAQAFAQFMTTDFQPLTILSHETHEDRAQRKSKR